MYGSETWVLNATEEMSLEVFEKHVRSETQTEWEMKKYGGVNEM